MEETLKEYTIDSEEGTRNIEITSVYQLINLLKKHDVPIEDWQFGSVFTLFREILLKDCQLVNIGDGLARISDVALIDLYSEDGKHFLQETTHEEYDNQDNLIKSYTHDYERSLAETKKTHETFQQAVTRGIWEELGIPEINHLTKLDEFELNQPMEEYKGLNNMLRFKKYSVSIPDKYFEPSGYTNFEPTYGYLKIDLEWQKTREDQESR